MYEFKTEHFIITVLIIWLFMFYIAKDYKPLCTPDMPDAEYGKCIKMLDTQDYDFDYYFPK